MKFAGWPTPQARDWKGPQGRAVRNKRSPTGEIIGKKDKLSFDLPAVANMVEGAEQIENGKLSPSHVRWLMGYPPAWDKAAAQIKIKRVKHRGEIMAVPEPTKNWTPQEEEAITILQKNNEMKRPAAVRALAIALKQGTTAEQIIGQPGAEPASTALVVGKKGSDLSFIPVVLNLESWPDEALARHVVKGIKKFSTYMPHVIELRKRFDNHERDSKGQLVVPILGCGTWEDFCNQHFDRTPQSVNRAMKLSTKALSPQPQPKTTESKGSKSQKKKSDRQEQEPREEESQNEKRLITQLAGETGDVSVVQTRKQNPIYEVIFHKLNESQTHDLAKFTAGVIFKHVPPFSADQPFVEEVVAYAKSCYSDDEYDEYDEDCRQDFYVSLQHRLKEEAALAKKPKTPPAKPKKSAAATPQPSLPALPTKAKSAREECDVLILRALAGRSTSVPDLVDNYLTESSFDAPFIKARIKSLRKRALIVTDEFGYGIYSLSKSSSPAVTEPAAPTPVLSAAKEKVRDFDEQVLDAIGETGVKPVAFINELMTSGSLTDIRNSLSRLIKAGRVMKSTKVKGSPVLFSKVALKEMTA